MTRAESIAEVRALMRAHGITLDDLRAELQMQLALVEPAKEEAPAVPPAEALTTAL